MLVPISEITVNPERREARIEAIRELADYSGPLVKTKSENRPFGNPPYNSKDKSGVGFRNTENPYSKF